MSRKGRKHGPGKAGPSQPRPRPLPAASQSGRSGPAERPAGQAWWQRDPGRLDRELRALAAAGYGPQRDAAAERAGVLRLTVRLPIGGREAAGEIVYPDEYPYFRPFVSVADLGLEHHWSPSTGEVCLLEKAGDAWSPSTTAAGLLDRQWPEVLRLNGLSTDRPGNFEPPSGTGSQDVSASTSPGPAGAPGEVPQAEPWTAYLEKSAPLVVVVPGAVQLPDGVDGGVARLRFREPGGANRFRRAAAADPARRAALEPPPVAFLAGLADERGQRLWECEDGLVPYRETDADMLDVGWVRLDAVPPKADAGAIWAVAGQSASHVRRDRRFEAVLVALPEETAQRSVGLGWTVVVRSRPRDSAPWSPPAAGQVVRAGVADLRTREPSLSGLSGQNVLLVGAGGLGSALGLELARAGPRTFAVLDGDTVDPAAAVRAPSAWRTAGMPKSAAMALLALDSAAYTGVEAIGRRLGVPRLGLAADDPDQFWATWQAVLQADAVVDATADFGVHLMLSDMAAASGAVYVLAEATRGVHGGTVAAVSPEALAAGGGCWRCLARHRTDGTVPAPPASAGKLVQPLGCGEPTYTGAGFDLSILAAHAARVVVAALTGPDGYGTFAEPVHVVSLRGPDGAPIPAAWTAHGLPAHPDCDHVDRAAAATDGSGTTSREEP